MFYLENEIESTKNKADVKRWSNLMQWICVFHLKCTADAFSSRPRLSPIIWIYSYEFLWRHVKMFFFSKIIKFSFKNLLLLQQKNEQKNNQKTNQIFLLARLPDFFSLLKNWRAANIAVRKSNAE